MNVPEPPSWVALLTLMVHGPDATLRGAIRSREAAEGEESEGWFAWGRENIPVFAGARSNAPDDAAGRPLLVWRDGVRVRIEEADGSVNLIADESTCWQFELAQDVPVATARRNLRYRLGGTELLARRTAEEFAGDDFTRPTGPVGSTTFLTRPAWTVELAPPRHKPHPMQLVVDAETGIVLQQRIDGFGGVKEWTGLVVGEPLDPALFTWTGPSRSRRDEQAAHRAEHRADLARRLDWFTANVAATPLRVEVAVEPFVHEYDERTGAFQASLGDGDLGLLARRPRSDKPWRLGWSAPAHRWSTVRWDWALGFPDAQPTPEGIAALKRQLDVGG